MIVPWYDRPADPDAWHRVRAPGGYEWWYFEAHDAVRDVQVVAVFYDGFPFSGEYLRRYRRYRRRPTRHAPPVARDFPCVSFVVYGGGKVLGRWVEQFGAEAFEGSTHRPEVVIGQNRLATEDGRLVLRLSDPRLGAELIFAPQWGHAAVERELLVPWSGEHRWVIANPLCEVEGYFFKGGEREPFKGVGYHDHQFGTAPIGEGAGDWICGRAYFGDSVYAFHRATKDGGGSAGFGLIVMCDAEGIREIESKDPGGPLRLRLRDPQEIDERRLRLEALDSASQKGVAFCESVCGSRFTSLAEFGARRWEARGSWGRS